VSLACLLCGSGRYSIHSSLSAQDLLKCWAVGGHQFSPDVTQPLLEAGKIHLYECRDCGFHFFDPELAGGAKFYEQLHAHSEGYYAPNRPENERNANYAVQHGNRRILDIGCGSGLALDVAKRAGLETFGIELSATAAAAAARGGHTIFPVLLENLDSAWEGKFDLISLNQLLEHVPDPVALVRQCTRFLSPRGSLAIAVPGRETILRLHPWLETNWPPHHLSRWRKQDFHLLAQRTGLQVVETGTDQLLGSAIQSFLLEHRQRCRVLGKPYRGLPSPGIRAVAQIYRKTGLKYLVHRGQSIYCFLTRAAFSL
jgi:SAM-dependent methyltransferase